MRVEPYSDSHFPDVARLIKEFHEEAVGEYDGVFSADAVIETIKTADYSNTFLMIVNGSCQGLLHGGRIRSPVNGQSIFQEIIWFVSKPYRGRGVFLLNEVERVLKSQGVGIMIMGVLENSKTEKLKELYERMGYKKMETHYVRSL